MPDTAHLLAFVGAALVLLLSPGPAVLFVVTRSVQLGRRAGFLAILGLSVGGLVHVVAAVVGLSAVVAASAELFTVLKLLGAAYLVYLGVKTLTGHGETEPDADAPPQARSRLFLDGLIVNVFNPKAALFFLAFLPQFVTAGGAPVQLQLAVLGVVFLALGLVTDSLFALLAGSARRFLVGSPRIWRAQRVVSGTIYLGLGLTAALTGRGGE